MICRLCLIAINSEKSVSLFDEFGSNDEQQLVKIILKFLHLDITRSDEFSTAICHECAKHLTEFDKYCAYVRKQQTTLSQRVLVGQQYNDKNTDTALSEEPMEEVQFKCESEDVLTMETQFKCEPEETIFTEMALLSSTASCSSSLFHQINANGSAKILDSQLIDDSSNSCSSEHYFDSLPSADTIRQLQPLKQIYKNFSMGHALQNKDRVHIAKAVIDECLKNRPSKMLQREEFLTLAETIKEVYPSEFVSMYYIPSMRDQLASGKLYNAYSNKRTALRASGEIKSRLKTYLGEKVTPNAEQIKLLEPVQQIYKKYQRRKSLQNKDRNVVAKAVIDACLEENPNKIIKRDYFHQLTANIIEAFPTETDCTLYFKPSKKGASARGKLWSAYNNKRTGLKQEGLIQRRSRFNPSKEECTTSSLQQVADMSEVQVLEYIQSLEQNNTDWDDILYKWKQTHKFRNKKLKTSMSTQEYFTKFPALQSDKAIELLSIDVKILYPKIGTIENWLHLYERVLQRARSVRDLMIAQLIAEIDASYNERFRAGLTLVLVPYLFPHAGKRIENVGRRATKRDLQQRFIKEYQSISELHAEEEVVDLQIKFVKENGAITYAEFSIAGYKFKCIDILEALNLGFMFITALNIAYPKLGIHLWQFVQLAIYKIDLSYIRVSSLETIVNDIFKEV